MSIKIEKVTYNNKEDSRVLESVLSNWFKNPKELKDMEGRVRADVWYIENWSLALDINLVALTVWNVIKGDEKAY